MQCEFYQFNQDFVHSLKESNKKTINKNKKGKGIIGNRGNTSFDSVSFL